MGPFRSVDMHNGEGGRTSPEFIVMCDRDVRRCGAYRVERVRQAEAQQYDGR